MFGILFKFKDKNVKQLFLIQTVFFLIAAILISTIMYYAYRTGYEATQEKGYLGVLLISAGLFIALAAIFIIYLVVLIIFNISYAIRVLLFSLVYAVPFCTIYFLTPYKSIQQGYYDYLTDNHINIEQIRAWMTSYEFGRGDDPQYGYVFERNWPDCIRCLHPKAVVLKEPEGKIYLRIIYSFGPSVAFGLCVTEEPTDVPLYDPQDGENRIQLQENAFVW